MSVATLAPMRGSALTALLRRDLLGGSRAGSLRIARGVALGLSGGAVLVVYSAQPRMQADWGSVAMAVTFAMLSLVSAVSAPQAAIQAIRRERDRGMLDLLVMAGLTPWLLALGRILSTFANLLSLLLATLPAFALLRYFGSPSAHELIVGVALICCAWLALASYAVAISAWAPSSAVAGVVAIGGLIAYAALAELADIDSIVLGSDPLLVRLLGLDRAGASATGIDFAAYAGRQLVTSLGCWCLAAFGIRRRTRPPRTRLEGRAARRHLAVGGWPLTSLVLHRATLARPGLLVLLLAIPPLVHAWKGPRETLVAGWILAGLALLIALLVPALHVGVARERSQWDSLMSTSMPGRRTLLDLVRASLVASAAPMAAGLLAVAIASAAQVASPLPRIGITVSGLLVTWLVVAALGTTAGLLATGPAAAVRYCGGLVVVASLAPFLAYATAQFLTGRRLILPAWAYVVLLVVLLGVSIAGIVSSRRNRTGAPLFCVPLTWSLVIVPGFMIADVREAAPYALGGLSGLVRITLHAAPYAKPPLLQLAQALPHVLLAAMLLAALLGRADRWLGRAG